MFLHFRVSVRTLPALLVLLLGVAGPAPADIPVVELRGVVHAVSAAHVLGALDRADASGAPLVILKLDSGSARSTSCPSLRPTLIATKSLKC